MVEAPGDSRLLSETVICQEWVDTTRVWVGGVAQFALVAVVAIVLANLMGQMDNPNLLFFLGAIALIIWQYRRQRIERRKGELDVIAISPGHPWHDSEDVGDTSVYVLNHEDQWIALKPNVRIVSTFDSLLEHVLLRDGDAEGEVVVRCNLEFPNVVPIINMAQALANAQDRGEDDVDSFDAAREREETAEGLLEREWMDTEEGAVDYEPGAILRAFKRSMEGSDDP